MIWAVGRFGVDAAVAAAEMALATTALGAAADDDYEQCYATAATAATVVAVDAAVVAVVAACLRKNRALCPSQMLIDHCRPMPHICDNSSYHHTMPAHAEG